MAKSKLVPSEPLLPWDLPEPLLGPPVEFRHLRYPLWTGNKAKLIQSYLFYFEMITHHGTYIDGFAGPQDPGNLDTWAAKLVLEFEPKWFTTFYLFELNKKKVKSLERLRDEQPPCVDAKGRRITRRIRVQQGDFNSLIHELLATRPIKPKEATFCLLDQRTFECKWSTVTALAEYKPSNENKIELFYFLPNSWIDRALAGLKRNPAKAIEWWGGSDPLSLRRLGAKGRCDSLCERFKTELGYKYATPWPIYEKAKGRGAVMYYMIHATDHPVAPSLMERAFHQTVLPKRTQTQIEFNFGDSEVQSTDDTGSNGSLTLS